jgi:hypothetical protein
MSFFTRKATNTSRMETLAPNPVYRPEEYDALNKRYQAAYKTFIKYKYEEIQKVMADINEGVRMLNKLVTKPALNKDLDNPRIESITSTMKIKLDLAIPLLERGEKYKTLQALIFDLGFFYKTMVATKKQPYTDRNFAVIHELQRNLAKYQSSTTTNTPMLNARAAAVNAAAATASRSYNMASTSLNKRFEGVNVGASILGSKMNAATGVYGNEAGPTAGVSNNEVNAFMRALAPKAMPKFPTVPSHPIKPRGGSRRRRYTRRHRL